MLTTLEMQDRSEIMELFERSFNDHLEKLERLKRKLEIPEYSFVFLKRGKHEEKWFSLRALQFIIEPYGTKGCPNIYEYQCTHWQTNK